MTGKKIWGSLLTGGLLATTLTACSGGANSAEANLPIPDGLKPYYSQAAKWETCPENPYYQCAQVEVPINYEKPKLGSIKIAVNRLISKKGENQPTLFMNPGGPGDSGKRMLLELARKFDKRIKEKYNLVGFDPRGVGDSQPIMCLSAKERDENRADSFDLSKPEQLAAAEKSNQHFIKECEAHLKPKMRLADYRTDQTVRDLDILRHVIGKGKLNFLGESYGTALGLKYAAQFPQQVNRMVLDAVVNPNINYSDLSAIQTKGFQEAFEHFTTYCIAKIPNCPFSSVADAETKVTNLLNNLEKQELSTGPDSSRQVTRSIAEHVIISSLYGSETYKALSQVLDSALKGDGLPMLRYSDILMDRLPNGQYENNFYDAFLVIDQLDYHDSSTTQQLAEKGQQLQQKYPIFGAGTAYQGLIYRDNKEMMSNVEPPKHIDYEKIDIPSLLMLSNAHDPSTPPLMAQQVHKAIKNSVLIETPLYRHTTMFIDSKRINKIVSDYLVDGNLPTQKEIKINVKEKPITN